MPNTLFLYVILEACGGACLTIYSARKYQAYISASASTKDLSILGTISWLFPLTAGFVFVFSTVSAALRAKGAYFGESPVATWVHNILFFAVPVVYISITLVGFVRMLREKRLTKSGLAAAFGMPGK